jgi:hypothetical protein
MNLRGLTTGTLLGAAVLLAATEAAGAQAEPPEEPYDEETAPQVLTLGGQPIQFQLGGRSCVARPAGGPDWSLRFGGTRLFPT